MAEEATKVPVTATPKEQARPASVQPWRPYETLRYEIDRLFDDFGFNFPRLPSRASILGSEPVWFQTMGSRGTPAVDFVEKDQAYEVTAELPGLEQKEIEVKIVNGSLRIRGDKKQEKEEKSENYYLSERYFGSFERSFPLPEDVDAEKIEATFAKGVLTVTLPKHAEGHKAPKKIEVKAT
jgi:HSP20 family protein